MSTATATPANTTTGLIKAVEILWGTGCPNAREDRSRLGQWFQFSVHHMDTPWYNLASCATFGELVAYMTKVAEMGRGGWKMTKCCNCKREALEATIWDLYKDVHGMRPRFLDLGKMTEGELFALIERLAGERS